MDLASVIGGFWARAWPAIESQPIMRLFEMRLGICRPQILLDPLSIAFLCATCC